MLIRHFNRIDIESWMFRKHRILLLIPVAIVCISLFSRRKCFTTGRVDRNGTAVLTRELIEDRLVPVENRVLGIQTNTSKKPSCSKNDESDTYKICDGSLPFSSTECGKSNPDSYDKYKVPNIIHYVWFGEMNLKYYHYLSVRSAAANQHPDAIIFHVNGSKPGGEYWKRVENEIPCIKVMKMKAPTSIYGNEISDVLHQTDVARMQILLEYGGIYLDSDVLILKSMDPLRKYPFTIGRSTEFSLSNGLLISESNSTFLREWMSLFSKYDKRKLRGIHYADLSTKLPLRLHSMRPDLPLHLEETSLQRPNPWIDGRTCISHASYNISDNYALHIHPQKSKLRDPRVLSEYREEELRSYDTTYGAGARAALFGSQDLVFFKSELSSAKNMKNIKNIPRLKPISEYSFSSLFP